MDLSGTHAALACFLNYKVHRMERIPMTMAGHKVLEEELHYLKTVERHAVIKMIAEARAHGDLSENAEYHAAKDRQSFIEGRMMDLEDKISRAQVIDLSKLSGKTVTFGATVILGSHDTHSQVKYQIVGDLESDLKQGRVSISSPMPRALIRRGSGDVIEVTAPGGARSYEILNVSFV